MPVPRRVVVTGLGIVSPLGNDVTTTWRRIIAGESGIGPVTKFDASPLDVRIAGEVRGFDPETYIDRRVARRLDANVQYAVAAAHEAAAMARLDLKAEAEQIGAVIGTASGGSHTLEEQMGLLHRGGRMSAFAVTMMIPNMAAGYVSIQLGLKGPLSTVCTACASGANAVGDAFEVIRRGAATAMFAGGTEASVDAITFRGFCAIRALSTRNDSPTEASRPFDLARDGFVVSEGAAILVLEELEHARRRGAEILAEIVGYGMSADALNVVQPDPSGAPQARALSLALAEAGLTPDEVEYVNAHGTSTPLGDIAETRALTMVLGDHAARTPVSSTKSMIGHMLGAAGAIEAAFAVLAIKHGIVPPTINLRHPDPECTLDYVPNAARYQTIGTAVSTSFAFGGHNVALAFKACSQ